MEGHDFDAQCSFNFWQILKKWLDCFTLSIDLCVHNFDQLERHVLSRGDWAVLPFFCVCAPEQLKIFCMIDVKDSWESLFIEIDWSNEALS